MGEEGGGGGEEGKKNWGRGMTFRVKKRAPVAGPARI